MKVNQEMYSTIFNSITDANKLLEQAGKILKQAQEKAEAIYIEQNEDNPSC